MNNIKDIKDFSKDINNIILNLSMTNGKYLKLAGSMSLSNQLYASDFDLIEIIPIKDDINKYVSKFKSIIKHFIKQNNAFIGDIKSGEILEWKILNDDIYIENKKIYNYNSSELLQKVKILYDNNIIDDNEYNESLRLLKPNINIDDYYLMKDFFKFHTIRWKPEDIINGYKILQNNEKIYLKESIINGPNKLDLIYWLKNRFIEFSIIYKFNSEDSIVEIKNQLRNKNELSKNDIEMTESLKTDILKYMIDGNYYKMAKRIFSITDDIKLKDNLTNLFNSDLGKLYLLNSDIKTLIYLFENSDHLPYNRIKKEISNFRKRTTNIKIPLSLKNNVLNDIIEYLKNIEENPNINDLLKINKYLDGLLSKNTKKYLKLYKILPLNNKFLP